MKNIRGSKLIVVIIRIYMEISKGKSLCNYFYLKQTKISCFLFCLFSFFSSTKFGNSRVEEVLPRVEGRHQGKGEVLEKGSTSVNRVQRCVHM
jgi:hypothetical protein